MNTYFNDSYLRVRNESTTGKDPRFSRVKIA